MKYTKPALTFDKQTRKQFPIWSVEPNQGLGT